MAQIYIHKKACLVRNDNGEYIEMTELQLRRRLKLKEFKNAKAANLIIEDALQNNQVDLHASLAGHFAGYEINNGFRVLERACEMKEGIAIAALVAWIGFVAFVLYRVLIRP